MKKPRVLFVDDEQLILQGLRRSLRPMRGEWDMAFANSADEALNLMAENPCDVVVADMRMPGKDGVQLLNEVKSRYPKCVRFVLSGHADREVILRSLGVTHQYLSKPCEPEKLKSLLNRALALNAVIQGDPLFEPLIARIRFLPSHPALYLEIQDALSAPDCNMGRIAEIIARDPAITAKILQLVNSAFFGVPQRVTDPKTALSLLGVETLQAVLLSAHAFGQFEEVPMNIDLDRMWHHSALVGSLAAQIVAFEGNDKATRSAAKVAGLLHDVGKLVLLANLPEDYERLKALSGELQGDMIELERLEWGATHAEIGAYLLGLWGLPEEVVEAVALHHSPGEALGESFSAIPAVFAANAFANEMTTGDEPPAELLESADIGRFAERFADWRAVCLRSFAELERKC